MNWVSQNKCDQMLSVLKLEFYLYMSNAVSCDHAVIYMFTIKAI